MGNATSKDGALTKICESIPIVGTATAGIHALAGNGDHAKRALAVSTGSLIKAGGAIGGFCVGGPLGAVAGGAAAASLGIGAEYGISKTIDDPNVKGDVGSVSLKRIAIETVIGGGTAMIGGGGAAAVKEAGTQIAKSTASQVAKGLLKEAAEEAGKELLRHGTQTTLTQIATKAAVQTTVQAAQQLQKIRPTLVTYTANLLLTLLTLLSQVRISPKVRRGSTSKEETSGRHTRTRRCRKGSGCSYRQRYISIRCWRP